MTVNPEYYRRFVCRDMRGGRVEFRGCDDAVRPDALHPLHLVDPDLRVPARYATPHAAALENSVRSPGAVRWMPSRSGPVAAGLFAGEAVWEPYYVEAVLHASQDIPVGLQEPQMAGEALLAGLHRTFSLNPLSIPGGLFGGRLRFPFMDCLQVVRAVAQSRGTRDLPGSTHGLSKLLDQLIEMGSFVTARIHMKTGAKAWNLVEIDHELVPASIPFAYRHEIGNLRDDCKRGGKPVRKRLEELRYNIFARDYMKGVRLPEY